MTINTKEIIKVSDQDLFEAGPKGDDLTQWTAIIKGPADSPYKGGKFPLEIKCDGKYWL